MLKKLVKTTLAVGLCSMVLSLPISAEPVMYNTNTGVYHKTTCRYVKRSKSMIKIDKKQAVQKGGRACKVCGG